MHEIDVTRLAEVPILAGCAREDLLALDRRATELRLRAGRTICHQGGRPRELVLLLAGHVDLTDHGRLVRRVGPGHVLGREALASGDCHDVTAVTTSEVLALVVGAPDAAELREVAPQLAARLAGEAVPVVVEPTPSWSPRRAVAPTPAFAFAGP
jgi:CRP-like cAMP-binding protein